MHDADDEMTGEETEDGVDDPAASEQEFLVERPAYVPELAVPGRLCADLPGVGGIVKAAPEDFVVEEVPLYAPSGEGPHVYLWIQKRDASAKWLLRCLSRHLDVPERELGTAGNKDRQAVTRQWVSIEGHRIGEPEDIANVIAYLAQYAADGATTDPAAVLQANGFGHSDEDEGEEVSDSPLTVAETSVQIRTMAVSEAVMQLELQEVPALMFRNAGHGRLNMVYRRPDGHIGWVDPADASRN